MTDTTPASKAAATPEARLAALGIALPDPGPGRGAMVPFVRVGSILFTSGQVAMADGRLLATGQLGAEVDVETGRQCARQCAINLLGAVKAAVGSLDNVRRVVKLTVFVASAPGFNDQPTVGHGASDLMLEVFGDAGRHSRSAIGLAELPLDSPVEVEAIFELA